MKPFFITGLPRSRTAWLANFFTYGRSFCWHDSIANGNADADTVMEQLQRIGTDYVGDADSHLIFLGLELQRRRPDARWLFINRDAGAALDSFLSYFGKRPYPGVPNDRAKLKPIFELCLETFNTLKQKLRPGSFIEVEFEDLNSKLVLEEAWRFLTPGNPWIAARFELLDKLQTNVMPEKVKHKLWRSR